MSNQATYSMRVSLSCALTAWRAGGLTVRLVCYTEALSRRGARRVTYRRQRDFRHGCAFYIEFAEGMRYAVLAVWHGSAAGGTHMRLLWRPVDNPTSRSVAPFFPAALPFIAQCATEAARR